MSGRPRRRGVSKYRKGDRAEVRTQAELEAAINGQGRWVSVHQRLPRLVLTTAEDWCTYHGVAVNDGVALVYKGLSDDFTSTNGFAYLPGTVPVAPDWDGGQDECGRGLHFSPSPAMTLQFHECATRFVACPVALADMRAPRSGDAHPEKIKARGCCGPVVEVDRFGEPVVPAATAEATA